MKRPLYFAVQAFGFPGHPFPKFWDNYKTLKSARAAAVQAVRDGWNFCEILKDKPKPPGFVGVYREKVETVTK